MISVRRRKIPVWVWMAGVGLALGALALLLFANVAFAADPSGADISTLEKADQNWVALDFVWVLVAAFLVFLMQGGFAMLEAGFCRAKNAVNLMMKNLMDFSIGSFVFFAIGFAIMFGSDGGIIGTNGWFLSGDNYDVGMYLTFIFQVMFAATAATIVSGAVAERLKIKAYFIYSIFICAIIYPIYGHWVWGGGWLSSLPFGAGHLDFAGSGVVHAIGGFVGLAGAIVLGPRIGKYTKDGKARGIPGHSITLAALGCFLLWFGWFGFNPGSTLSAHDLRISVIAVNTNMAAAVGACSALVTIWLKTKRLDVGMAINGAIAGLVAITASCAFVEAWAACVIGLIAGIIVVLSIDLFDRLKIDDPVGAVSVHGVNGVWGLLTVGLFADGTYGDVTGLFYGGGLGQLASQAIGVAVCVTWAFVAGFILFKVMDMIFGIRVSPQEEIDGLDIHEHGARAYPGLAIVEDVPYE